METIQQLPNIAKANRIFKNVSEERAVQVPSRFSFTAQANAFENARYFWMALFMTAQSCLGAIASMFILASGANMISLSLCAAITMGSNAMFIGLASPKVCLGTFYTSVFFNLMFILLNMAW